MGEDSTFDKIDEKPRKAKFYGVPPHENKTSGRRTCSAYLCQNGQFGPT
jgi:hypothetical protein